MHRVSARGCATDASPPSPAWEFQARSAGPRRARGPRPAWNVLRCGDEDVSADATAAHIEAALTAGAAHYVTKPVNLGAFLAIVDELLVDIDTHFG